MPLRQQVSDALGHIQERLFPWLRETVGPLTEDHERLVTVLAMARIEAFVQMHDNLPGRPLKDRHALTRAFVAKAVLDLPTTAMLIERLAVVPQARFQHDATLRRLCGWACAGAVPSEATFSRAFAELAECDVPARMHEALIERTLGTRIVGHIARDATAIEAREKPLKADKAKADKDRKSVV